MSMDSYSFPFLLHKNYRFAGPEQKTCVIKKINKKILKIENWK